MKSLQIKVCGMRDSANITAVAKLPIDALGFIFAPQSKRYVQKRPDLQSTKGKLRVGVFVDADIVMLERKSLEYDLLLLQLHGKESPAYCKEVQQLGIPIMKAFAVDENFDFQTTETYAPYCRYFLFDTKGPKAGGNGRPFNWDLLQQYQGETPFFLSGGLGLSVLNELQNFKHPRCVGLDLNSRFELKPAYKDVAKLNTFITEMKQNPLFL